MADLNFDFSARLKAAVKRAGVTQGQLADYLGMHQSVLSRYFSTGRVPEWHILVNIADRLTVSCDWLLTGKEPCTGSPGLPAVLNFNGNIGLQLKQVRLAAGLSQKAFAELHGIPLRSLLRYEAGHAPTGANLRLVRQVISKGLQDEGGHLAQDGSLNQPLTATPDADQSTVEPATMGKGVDDEESALLDQVLSELEAEKRASMARLAQLRACHQERKRLEAEVQQLSDELAQARAESLDARGRALASAAWRRLGLDGPFDLGRLLEVVSAGISLAGVEKPEETIHEPKVGPASKKPVKEHGPGKAPGGKDGL